MNIAKLHIVPTIALLTARPVDFQRPQRLNSPEYRALKIR